MSSKHILPRLHTKGPFTVEVAGSPEVTGETKPRRNAKQPEYLTTTHIEGVDTLFAVIQHGAQTFGDLPAMGTRKLIKKHVEVKTILKVIDGKSQPTEKVWTFFELDIYRYITHKELQVITQQIGSGLRKLGLVPYDRLHIFASTTSHWLLMAHGAFCQSMSIVTAYDTLGEEGLRHSLAVTKPKVIFVEPHLLGLLTRTLESLETVKHIIYNTESMDSLIEQDIQNLRELYPHIQVMDFEELRLLGENNPAVVIPPEPEEIACIMFTSGTGAAPKGVELTHRNIVAAMAGGIKNVEDALAGFRKLNYLAYLPLAHIFELVFEHAVLQLGGCLGYGSPRTLSQASCRNCKGDIQEFKPVFLVGIPAVWETVRKGILNSVMKSSKLVQALFWASLAAKRLLVTQGLPGVAILDALVFNKIRQATGGELRVIMTGGAPIAKITRQFLSMVLAPMINGYGMTETSGMGLLGDPLSWTAEAHGEPPTCVEMKLVDYPDAGYFTTNVKPQGEICIRGPAVMKQYFESPELTREAFVPGQWFKTGDIGQWEENGQLTIIDRTKNLVKTLNGEYISIEKLESIYRSAAIVANICIYATPYQVQPVAIVFPVEFVLKEVALSQGRESHGMDDPVNNQLAPIVHAQLLTVAKKAGLANIECIHGVIIATEEWTPHNGMVTPTNKLNRKKIALEFEEQIANVYNVKD